MEWEKAAITALRKYFGYQELKGFQREALEAWAENRDSFVLAATGSGNALRSSLISFVDLIFCLLQLSVCSRIVLHVP